MEKNKNILELAGSGLVTCQLLADDGRQCVWQLTEPKSIHFYLNSPKNAITLHQWAQQAVCRATSSVSGPSIREEMEETPGGAAEEGSLSQV